ncbi:hypothetical protein F5B20DRAFT_593305 [Whalleya microplaca]|nr:hypothetical protein F5B20DRAFT_593305 [Whalleya microplaca]
MDREHIDDGQYPLVPLVPAVPTVPAPGPRPAPDAQPGSGEQPGTGVQPVAAATSPDHQRPRPHPHPVATIRNGPLPREYVTMYQRAFDASWNRLHPEDRSQFCRFCGKMYKTRETRKQHDDDVHIGKRCHFQLHDGICGDVFDTEEAIIMHLDNHLLPLTVDENGKIECGWVGDCEHNHGYSTQQRMFRHARKLHKEKALEAGDVVEAWVDGSSSDSEADNPEADDMGGDIPGDDHGPDDYQDPPPSGGVAQEIPVA